MLFISVSVTAFYGITNILIGLVFLRLMGVVREPGNGISFNAVIGSAFFLGQGLLANVWLLLGLLSFFTPPLIWAILIGSAFAGIFFVSNFFLATFDVAKDTVSKIQGLSLSWKILLGLLSLLIFLYGLGSILQPPTGDAEAFYMVVPKIMAASERLALFPNYSQFFQIGLLGEMHFAALMSIADPFAAKLFAWFVSLGLMVLLLSLCSRIGLSFPGQIIAIIILFTSSTFTYYITDGKVDIFGGAFGIGAYYWATYVGADRKIPALILTGLFCGFSFLAKISNIPVILSGILTIVIWNHLQTMQLKRDSMKRCMGGAFVSLGFIGFFILLAISPHFVKNWVFFGEPFAPFLFLNTIGGRWVEQTWFSPENTKFILLTYPFAIIYGQYPMQAGNLSALVLAFLPLLMLIKRPASWIQNRLFQISIAAAIGLITWMIFRPSVLAPRYVMATLLLFIPLAARGAEKIFYERGYNVLKTVVYLSLVFSLVLFLDSNRSIPKRFFNFLSRDLHACEEAGIYCRSMTFLNEYAASGDRIYVGGYYTYYLRPDLLQCMSGPPEGEKSLRALKTPEDRWEYFCNQGFKFLVVQRSSHSAMLQSFSLEMLPSWLEVRQIYDDPEALIYHLDCRDSKRNPRHACRQVRPPAWDVVEQ